MKRILLRRTRWAAAFLAATMMVMLTGCGRSSVDSVASATEMDFSLRNETGSGGILEEMAVAEAGEEGTATTSPQLQAKERKLIKTVYLEVETREFDNLMSVVENQVTQLGGYIESMDTFNGSSYYGYQEVRNSNLTARIPKDNLDSFLNTVSGVSNVISRSDTVEDVTLTYVDLESHKEALQTEQERLLALLQQAESIEDIITIEQRMSEVRYQLQSMESQLRTYDNQVDYSTVHLGIQEVEVFTPLKEKTVWERISGGFVESIRDIGEHIVEFAIAFVIHIPYLIVWGMLVAAIVLMVCVVIRRSNRKKAPKEQKKEEK